VARVPVAVQIARGRKLITEWGTQHKRPARTRDGAICAPLGRGSAVKALASYLAFKRTDLGSKEKRQVAGLLGRYSEWLKAGMF